MWAPDPDRRSAMGLAALMVAGAVAGFLAAEPAASREYETVGTVGDDARAYAVDLDEETRLRLVLSAASDDAPPQARFSVYDPADEHLASMTLEGDGDEATVVADRPGSWVVFVSETDRGDVELQVDDGEASARSLEVTERRWTVAESQGDAVDAHVAFRVDPRPADARLQLTGPAEDLDARAASEEGAVHAIEDGDADESGRLVNGSERVRYDNLAAGTYEVEAQATSLNGTLDLVAETYVRDRPANATPDDPEPGTPSGAEVARLGEDEAALVAPQGAGALSFQAPEDGEATVYVYNASDDLVAEIDVGDRDQRGRDDGNASPAQATTYELAAGEPHAVYVADLHAHGWDDRDDHQVVVRLPDVDEADPAPDLNVTEDTVTVEGENGTAAFEAPGGLVDVDARSDGWTWDSDDVTVEGPRGVVLESNDADGDPWDGWWDHGYETYPERFSDGTYTVTVDEGDGFGFDDQETEVKYAYYER